MKARSKKTKNVLIMMLPRIQQQMQAQQEHRRCNSIITFINIIIIITTMASATLGAP